jgi:hypothetical protein
MSESVVVTVKQLRAIADQDDAQGVLAVLEKYPDLPDAARVRLTFLQDSLRVDLLTPTEKNDDVKQDYPNVKVVGMGSMTLVGFRKELGTFGNCWGGMLKGDKHEHQVVNIGWESLDAAGVPFPLDGILIDECIAITDKRIPSAAFRARPCSVHHDAAAFQIWKDLTADA